jgi:hypothetical protein
MRAREGPLELRCGPADWAVVTAWQKLLLGLAVSLLVPALALSGAAIPLPSGVYRAAVALVQRTQQLGAQVGAEEPARMSPRVRRDATGVAPSTRQPVPRRRPVFRSAPPLAPVSSAARRGAASRQHDHAPRTVGAGREAAGPSSAPVSETPVNRRNVTEPAPPPGASSEETKAPATPSGVVVAVEPPPPPSSPPPAAPPAPRVVEKVDPNIELLVAEVSVPEVPLSLPLETPKTALLVKSP